MTAPPPRGSEVPLSLHRPLFVIGTGRSGSTLAYALLSRHADLAWFSTYEQKLGVTTPKLAKLPLRVPALRDRAWRSVSGRQLRPSEPYEVLDAAFPGFSQPFRNLRADDVTPWAARRIRAALEERVQREGKDRLILKWTGWSRAGFMDRIFPDALFVHVHRDGRAVSSSLLQQPWWLGWRGPEQWRWGPLSDAQRAIWEAHDRSFLVLAGFQWQLCFREIEESTAALPPNRVYRLSFEDLCDDPTGHCRRVFEWADLPWSESLERDIRATPIRPASIDRWRKDLDPEQAATLEDVFADDLAFQSSLPSGVCG